MRALVCLAVGLGFAISAGCGSHREYYAPMGADSCGGAVAFVPPVRVAYASPMVFTTGGPGMVACQPGDTCDLSCDRGHCAFVCAAGATCNMTCDGGHCAFACAAGATCNATCDGGHCDNECGDGSVCNATCDGGACGIACGIGSTCNFDCEGDDCVTRTGANV